MNDSEAGEPGSVTVWIEGLRRRDPTAVQALWERFFDRMVRRARDRLRSANRRAADEEDAALSAFDGFVRAAAAGRFPQLDDRDDLWQALLVVTERKAADLARKERAQVRGGGAVRGESAFAGEVGEELAGLDGFSGGEPPAALVAQLADDYQRRLDALDDDLLRKIAVMKLEGHESAELAVALGLSLRSIERKLALIRDIWDRTPDDASTG